MCLVIQKNIIFPPSGKVKRSNTSRSQQRYLVAPETGQEL